MPFQIGWQMSPKPGNLTSGGHHGSRSHAKELLPYLSIDVDVGYRDLYL